MKNLKLNLREFNDTEVLTRSQLKNVLGGTILSSDGLADCTAHCGGNTYITISCNGTCIATDGKGVTCGSVSAECPKLT